MSKSESNTARRVYVVKEDDADGKTINESLVKAGSQAQAIQHVVKGRFSAEAASVETILRLKDKEVAEAGAE